MAQSIFSDFDKNLFSVFQHSHYNYYNANKKNDNPIVNNCLSLGCGLPNLKQTFFMDDLIVDNNSRSRTKTRSLSRDFEWTCCTLDA